MPRPPDMRATGIGAYLLARRKKLNMSIGKLADMAGLSHSTVGDIERGQRSLTGRSARRMASPLGVTPNDLLIAANATLEFPWIEAVPATGSSWNAVVFHLTSKEEEDLRGYLESLRVRRWLTPIRRSLMTANKNQK